MKKNKVVRKLSFLVFAIYFTSLVFLPLNSVKAAPENSAKPAPENTAGMEITARSAILMEPASGKIIFEKNSHEKYAPASVTKIMTMLLSMEAVDSGKIKLTDKVTCSENAKHMGGSTMLLDAGEVRTVEELLKGIAVASGNDASVAMAEYLSGSEESFVARMNERAKELGMKDTGFKNCTGLSAPGHMTSAYDITIMSRELLKHPGILKYTGLYMETISEGRKSPIELVNHNKLVRFFKGCDGLKTGFTEEAKYCISATAVRDNVRMLSVIMGSPTYKIRNKEASMLLNYGFSKYEAKKIFVKDTTIEQVELQKMSEKFFKAKAHEDLNVIVEKGKECKITKKCIFEQPKNKKGYKAGDVVGYCEVYVNDEFAGKVKITTDRNIKKGNIFNNLKNNFKNSVDKGI